MSASLLPAAIDKRPSEVQSISNAHRKALQTRESGGLTVYSGM